MKKVAVALITLFSFLYLVYPSFGIFELIPDNLPLIGNLDEASATLLFLNGLRFFGVDLTRLYEKDPEKK